LAPPGVAGSRGADGATSVPWLCPVMVYVSTSVLPVASLYSACGKLSTVSLASAV
jgi:hypothetical protein